MSRQTIEQRVARGIALLNEKGPRGWRRRVRVTQLDMGDPCRCVLGQVFGRHDDGGQGYFWATEAHDSPLRGTLREGTRSSAYGFVGYDTDDIDSEHQTLTAEWRRQLRQVPR